MIFGSHHKVNKSHDSTNTDESEATLRQRRTAPWRALFFFTTKANLPCLILGITCSVIAGLAAPFTAFLTGKVFNGFTEYAAGQWSKEKLHNEEIKYIIFLVCVAVAKSMIHSLDFTLWMSFGELQAKSARDRLFYGLLEKNTEWYDMRKNGIGALLPRLQAQIRDLQLATAQPLGSTFALTSEAILQLAQALYYSWDLTLVTLSTAPIIMIAMTYLGNGMQSSINKQQDMLSEGQKHSTSAFTAIETVKCFNGQEMELKKYTGVINVAADWYYRVINCAALQMALVVLLSVSMFVQGFYYGGVLMSKGSKTSGDIVTTFLSAVGALQALQNILPQMIVLEKGRTAGSTLRRIMAEVSKGSRVQFIRKLLQPATCKGHIEVRNLSFAYPARPDKLALDDVTMSIPRGELTFLIGKSGSGKSTLGQLLVGFYSCPSSIFVDGLSLETLDVTWLRSNITLVEQQSLLFNDTIFRNIAFGRRDHKGVTKAEVNDAAEFALLQMMIADMPNGLDTMVGYKGGKMSGGQRQRMALARARLRNTPVLLLDESTSALDTISRSLVMDAIRRWRHGKTTIIITHDVSQIRPSDYLFVLEHGKIADEGRRGDLETVGDSPFEQFLPKGHQVTRPENCFTDPEYIHESIIRHDQSSVSTEILSLPRQAHYDPLDTQLQLGENKWPSFIPKLINEHNPVQGFRGYGRLGVGNVGISPRARYVLNLDLTSPRSPTTNNRFSPLWGRVDSSTASPSVGNDIVDDNGDARLLEQWVDRTGQLAMEKRRGAFGIARKRAVLTNPAPASSTFNTSIKAQIRPLELQDGSYKLPYTKILATVWPHLDVSGRFMLLLGFWGATVHATGTPAFSYILSKLIATYSIPGGDKHKALVYSMAILAVATVDAVHTYIFRFFLEYIAQRWVDSVRSEALKRILDQPRAFFDDEQYSVSRLTDNLDRNAEEMRNIMGRFVPLIFIAAIMTAITLLWALATQWKLTLIALCAAPCIFLVTKAFSKVSGKWETLSNDASETTSSVVTETFTNIKTVRALMLESHFSDKYVAATNHALVVGFKRSLYSGFFYGLSSSAGALATAMVFYVGIRLTTTPASVNAVVQVFIMLMFAIQAVGDILEYIPQIGNAQDTASRLLHLANLPRDSHEHWGDTRVGTVGNIVFDDLRFSYPTRPEQTILHDVNLTIRPGTCVAIVGGSGSGKSTIANLLLRIYSTPRGPPLGTGCSDDLTIAGRDLKEIQTTSLRNLIVPVSQNPTLFAATAAENISYGLDVDSPYNNPTAIAAAAQQAGIHEFIQSLPSGYDTPIGDGGLGLSGGQAQRIAIARALVRHPSVLVLDEATSALDVEAASLIRATLKRLVDDPARVMTVIIITHSRDMMEIAEEVFVLDHGSVVEKGGLEELLDRNGALANLLNGGRYDEERVVQEDSGRRRGVLELKEPDWQARKRPRRGLRL